MGKEGPSPGFTWGGNVANAFTPAQPPPSPRVPNTAQTHGTHAGSILSHDFRAATAF